MNDKIVVRRLRGGSLFKLIFIGNFTFFLPFSLIAGILGMFGADSVTCCFPAIDESIIQDTLEQNHHFVPAIDIVESKKPTRYDIDHFRRRSPI